MMTLANEEIAIALAMPLLMVVAQTVDWVATRLDKAISARCVERVAQMIVASEDPSEREMRGLSFRFTNVMILDAVMFISEHIYGNMLNRLALIAEDCKIEKRLLAPVWQQENRIDLLLKFSHIAPVAAVAECANWLVDDTSNKSRFCITAALVASRPERAVRHIAMLNFRLSPHEVAWLSQLLRRVGAPIAYTPMLMSENKNLQLIGIELVERFMAVDAEPHLQRLVQSEDAEVAYVALHALCTLRGDLSTPHLADVVRRLPAHCRESFIRHAVLACYSIRSCSHLLNKAERVRFTQLLNSYKCSIICN
ncbi:MAG: hypothetical protein J6V21_08005 [Alistipes sp.]|nr:hypothetical protein [Alistipes sp.]